MGEAEKIKIRRSSGKIQYVTREELDELNAHRKQRDQKRGWGRVSNPVQQAFSAILILLGISVIALWLKP
tara:strand:- start:153 stop:362 length:210 start_codon:yes stop_codon:yes gene_type:complete